MKSPRINRIEIQGFRAFGKNKQELVFGSLIAAVWAPNSQGKTSLAEAFEFLLTGQIVRRQLMASTQDEFADALQNAHLPAEMPVYVEAEIVRRTARLTTSGGPLPPTTPSGRIADRHWKSTAHRQARKTWPRLASSSRSPRLPPRC